ncbi:homoserine kinase [Alistipes senegalensis]|uniref:homoserine kinase n=1 Tax=Alistipes senegalensis TaxID=1288121 RepID=UPI00242BCBAF|nr:homoserine kinase [Alistipes senegalensis]MCI7307367.1 homoserine kinase [Alistipes senegalensis]MDD7038552.1 homoserine kinase [Alistipes senegalensis]MDY2875391.1 homoserine kinase [Alistipes senegalensis]
MKHIRVFAPGTVANLGCGFDVMGLTLDGVGDLLEIGAEEGAEGLEIRNLSGMNLPENIEENVITPALRAMLAAYGRPVRIEVTMLEKIAPGSGIGSSAASSAAAVYGLNELLDRPFSGKELVEFAMMGEALIGGTPHADNVGPAVLGGVVLIRGYEPFDIVRLPVPDNFFYAVAHPAIVVSTKDAREVLPREILLSKAVEQWGNVGGLVAGFALRDVALIGRSMHDAVVEPYRKGFIPGYDELKELVLAEGALAMNIAGSGPSVFALASDYGVAQRIAVQMERHFQLRQIGCHTYAGRVSNAGARGVEQ